MAVLKPESLSADEEREKIISDVITSQAPSIPGINAVRHITPLVMCALQRANNPYVTAQKGFAALGIEFEGDGSQITDAAAFGIAMMPKTAEVLILLSCDREHLRNYAIHPFDLEEDAMDFLEGSSMEFLAEATIFVSQQLMAISKSRAVKAPDERESPEAEALKGGNGNGPKKQAHTGSRKS